MSVLVYQDYVHGNGILFRRLAAHFGMGNVRHIDADDIANGALDMARLLVVPGGADLYYCEKLNGAGNKAIRAFVENGGAYLGICAGAYYACAALEWARDEADPIHGPRELAFYKGTATGPIYDFIESNDFEKSWDGAAALSFNGKTFPVLYSAGPVFSGDENALVLARYTGLPGAPAAIVECKVGKGRAILSSPHIEYDALHYRKILYRHRNPSYKWQLEVSGKLEQGQTQQGELWQAILETALPGHALKNAAA